VAAFLGHAPLPAHSLETLMALVPLPPGCCATLPPFFSACSVGWWLMAGAGLF
jgi:hypothetical protein